MSTTLDSQPPPSGDPKDEFKDLGFGTEVARGPGRRLLNRDGTFNVTLKGLDPLSSLSLYHWAVEDFLAAVSYFHSHLLRRR